MKKLWCKFPQSKCYCGYIDVAVGDVAVGDVDGWCSEWIKMGIAMHYHYVHGIMRLKQAFDRIKIYPTS